MKWMWWQQASVIALGASIGAIARWIAALWFNPLWHGFPLGTLLVNCVGGFLIGASLVAFERGGSEMWRLFAVTGFLGGLTTFSTFSGESLVLIEKGRLGLAVAHSASHLFGALGCAFLGSKLWRF